MKSLFDRMVDRITRGTNRRRVYQVAILSLVSAVICAAAFLFGAFYTLEMKIRAEGHVVTCDVERGLSVTLDVPSQFNEDVSEGQRVIVIDPEIKARYAGFRVEKVGTPIHETTAFPIIVRYSGPGRIISDLSKGQEVRAEIIYREARAYEILLEKDM